MEVSSLGYTLRVVYLQWKTLRKKILGSLKKSPVSGYWFPSYAEKLKKKYAAV
jgi:hypothetical protein